eukprot:TRINITY_DN20619_c0_g3_i3.p1 TRINITY_DN20619_c0_g3~~TRINITY_DN20619_c0_g3_i3.p1  ORF type:complete len:755 (-),score=53.23 TRINITY_DN20619_c0_g3_i3:75-2339(-)
MRWHRSTAMAILPLCLLLHQRFWRTDALMWRSSAHEVIVPLPGAGSVALSTRGTSAFRVRFSPESEEIDSPLVGPDLPDAPFERVDTGGNSGISTSFGSLLVTSSGHLELYDKEAKLLARSTGPGVPLRGGIAIAFLRSSGSRLYGRGAGQSDALKLSGTSVLPRVGNTESFVPYYWSTDGYAAMGVVNRSVRIDRDQFGGTRSALAVSYHSKDGLIEWKHASTFELYLMPAATLADGTRSYFRLTGMPRVPPRHMFGFIASRWGWKDAEYIEDSLRAFREGRFPLDVMIVDFEAFTKINDYDMPAEGDAQYSDFGFSAKTFPHPREQILKYQEDYHVRTAIVRKPRLGNSMLLSRARALGWTLNVSQFNGRYLNFSSPVVRDWYGEQLNGFLDAGVSFWWNDEGESEYFTYHHWNQAEIKVLRNRSTGSRFFSLNRAFTPGMARLGAAVWTGDIDPGWNSLAKVPGIMLNWGLAGAPYVACDLGGYFKGVTDDLLVRWFQLGVFMPLMRVHSAWDVQPHFPFLAGEPYASLLRDALELRYRLIPYHYSLAHRMFSHGQIWIEPMASAFPGDTSAAELTSQWMDGSLLVAPVLRSDSRKSVYLPAGRWYVFNSSKAVVGPRRLRGSASIDEVPMFVRIGSILTLAPVVQHTSALPGGPLQVHVYTGMNASFGLIEDDGETTGYIDGDVRTTRFAWNDKKRQLSWKVLGNTSSRQAFTSLVVTFFSRAGRHRSNVVPIALGGTVSLATLQRLALP